MASLVRIECRQGGIFLSRKMPIFYGALLLTGVNLLRFVGTSFQVYLSGRIGAEGIGLLQLVMSVGSMAMVAGMGGIRTATMYLTAEELGRKHPERVVWVLSGCILYSVTISSFISLGIYHFSPFIATNWIRRTDTASAIRLFAAFLPVNCLCGVMVGYFTGADRIGTLAAVEVAEQLLNMLCTIALLTFWAGHDALRCCQAVILGSGLSTCLTLTSLVILRLLEKTKSAVPIPVGKRLCRTALPLALADDLRTGISTAENLMVPQRLALCRSVESPLAAFGTVCGMVFPVLMFPAGLLFGLTELLIPELARCHVTQSNERIRYLARQSLRIALLFGSACGMLLYLSATEVCMHFYKSETAGMYLKWFAPLAVMLYCDAVTDAMIKGLGYQQSSVRYNIITNIMDVALLYVFLPKWGIGGYYLSFVLTHVINFILSVRKLLLITGLSIRWHIPVFTVTAAIASVLIGNNVSQPLPRMALSVTVFSCFLTITGVLQKEDALWLKNLIKTKSRPV